MAKENHIKIELDWLNEKAQQLRDYIDANPVSEIDDRIETVISSKGIPAVKVIAKKEESLKAWINALKEYAGFLDTLNELREIDSVSKTELRKGVTMNGMMTAQSPHETAT